MTKTRACRSRPAVVGRPSAAATQLPAMDRVSLKVAGFATTKNTAKGTSFFFRSKSIWYYVHRNLVSVRLLVLTIHLGRRVFVVIELLFRVIEDIRVLLGRARRGLTRKSFPNFCIHLGDIYGSVRLEEVFKVKIECWSVPELVSDWNLERHQDLIDRLFLSRTQTGIIFQG